MRSLLTWLELELTADDLVPPFVKLSISSLKEEEESEKEGEEEDEEEWMFLEDG